MTRYRAYLIGYEPPGFVGDERLRDRLMAQADICIPSDGPIPIGAELRAETVHAGNGEHAGIGRRPLRCVGHQHSGKVVLLEEF